MALLQVVVTNAYALDKLVYWSSNTTYVGYTPKSIGGSYYTTCYSDSFTTNFNSACSNAREEWSRVLPLSINSTSYNYATNYISGGTYTQLKKYFPDLKDTNSGLTEGRNYLASNVILPDGKTGSVWKYSAGGRCCIVEYSGATISNYKKTALHEMGHLFGWEGHSSSSRDVMYSGSSSVTSLTLRDANHLRQIYDLFY